MQTNVAINNYILDHPSKEVCDTLAKVRKDPCTIRRATNIAVKDKCFDAESNPYYEEVQNAGIKDSDLPTLKDFFEYMEKEEAVEMQKYKESHKNAISTYDGVRPALANWQMGFVND